MGYKPIIEYPEDVFALRHKILQIGKFSDEVIQCLYSEFSDTEFSAGWIGGPDTDGFREWLIKHGVIDA